MAFLHPEKSRLIELIRELAVVRGRVTLSSGMQADYYIDLRRVSLHHEAAPILGRVMLDLVLDSGYRSIEAVGGLTMGADPVATAMLHQAASRDLGWDAFVVRKQAKQHGLARQVEGPDVAGRSVLVVEDTSTTGGSPLTAVAALRLAGAEVKAVATVVDRDTGAREAIAAEGLPYLTAITLNELGL